MENNKIKLSKLSVAQQVRNLPADTVEEFKKLFASGEITMGLILENLQEKNLIADGVNYYTFHSAMAKIHNFKQKNQQSHGYLAESEYVSTWDYKKNQEEGLDPAKLTLKSRTSAWFLCPTGAHNSEKRRIDHHTNDHGCSKCGQQKSADTRSIPKPGMSLAEMYPLVAIEYQAGGNEIPASDVAARSNRVIGTFIPSCGNPLHRPYKQEVNKRTRNEDRWIKNGHSGSWCPWCSNEMRSKFHAEVCEYISSLIPLESGADLLVNQMILPHDDSLPDGTKYPNEIDFLSHDLKFALEIHGYKHDYDPEGYTESKKSRAEAMGFDFFVVWQRDWDDPEKRAYLKEQLKVIIGFKVMAHLKKKNRAVSNSFWAGDAA